ncbi:UDP-N-acetylmuramate dehydrogenase [Niabella terrae]
MKELAQNISLQPYNSFGIAARAAYFMAFDNVDTLREGLAWAGQEQLPVLILGGGSNMLLTRNWPGLVLKNQIRGIEKTGEDADAVYIRVGAGESWHGFVMYCLEQDYAGVENLALIPGLAGTAPMQNIGAYGVEIRDRLHELHALDRREGIIRCFSNQDCGFGYRESVFKNQYKDQYVITDVTFRLLKRPEFQIEYGAIRQELEKQQVTQLTIRAIAQAVIAIRSAKLPDPAKIGNAGSFFKNPSVSASVFEALQAEFPGIVGYANPEGTVKLAAGWLIEQAGWKGYRKGDAGVHEKQALVLVNYGGATGIEILELCQQVQEAVLQKFGVSLSPEVNIV